MPNTIISPSMLMPVPVVGVDPGPDWATNVNACLSIIDSHTHVAGQGELIPVAGLDINADLPINGHNIITIRSLRFTPQGSPLALATDLGCLYESGVDLYYNDGNGNQVRLTNGGSPAGATGTITGLPSGTASASYSAGTFTFQSATNTPASMSFGPIKIAQPVTNGKGVTLTPNVAQAADYGLSLPVALPAATSTILSDASGNLSFSLFTSGNYTPTFTTGTNTNSVTPKKAFYTRLGTGSVVTVFGSVDVDTAGPGNVVMRFTLPIASNLAAADDLSGHGSIENANLIAQCYAEPINNVVEMLFVAGGAVTYTLYYSYSYQVI